MTLRLRISPAVQARVIGRRMAGQTYREIAKAEGINKDTVGRVLTQQETDHLMRAYRSLMLERMVPRALEGLEHLLKKRDRQAIIETLYGSKVFSTRQEHTVTPTAPERTYDLALVMFRREKGRDPHSQEELIEFDKTVEVEPLIKESAASE